MFTIKLNDKKPAHILSRELTMIRTDQQSKAGKVDLCTYM